MLDFIIILLINMKKVKTDDTKKNVINGYKAVDSTEGNQFNNGHIKMKQS